MSADKKFDLGDYVEVKDRIRVFYELFGTGRLVTSGYELTREPDDKPKVIVTALAYRTPDDPHPGVGTSWMYLPGRTSYTLGSEIENVETSAWGRAIGSLGILIDKSIASANEIEGKRHEDGPAPQPTVNPNGSLIGIVEVGKTSDTDYEYRPDPQGVPQVGFVLVEGRKRQKIHAMGDLAEDLMLVKADLVGQRATCWGRLRPESFTPANAARLVTYYVLDLERLAAGAIALPLAAEAATEPLGLADDPEFDAAMARVP